MTKDTGASQPVGTLYAIVLDVNDLESCAGFWSEVLGKEISLNRLPVEWLIRPLVVIFVHFVAKNCTKIISLF
jgi:hypothetical protein